MRYALIFAGVAAAYDAYGYDSHAENQVSSSTPAVKYSSSAPAYGGYGDDYKTSSAPVPSKSSSSSQSGYTTITPGYGKQPVTVTSQYQPYPTCGAAGSDGKSCDKWNEDKYVSTVIEDCDSKKVTVTDVEKPITVYHTKTTITHYPTASSAGGKEGNAYPTGSYGYDDKKNGTKAWYEMYEKVHEIKYKDLGSHGLPGYGGSGLCESCDDEQPYTVKEYKNGKWSENDATAVYKAPTPETKTYEKPGVYTEPAADVTVSYTMTKPSEATTTAKAGVPVTYGGVTTDFKETGVKTCAYGAYETGKDINGNDVTSTVVRTVTVTVTTTGMYEVAKPTTTVYDHDAEVTYPTVSVYQPGVYHKDPQTVTITKAGETYSCNYKQTKTYPAASEKTPAKDNEYPHGGKDSSKPAVETNTPTEHKPDYPASTPSAKSDSKPDNKHPVASSAPAYPESTPVWGDKMSSSTPCASSSTLSVETKSKSEEYPAHPTGSVPAHDEEYPHGGKHNSSMPSVETKTGEYTSYPTGSVPAHGEEYPHGDKHSSAMPSVETKTGESPSYEASPVPSKDEHKSYPSFPESSSAPSYPATTTVPHYENGELTPCPSSTEPVDNGYKSSSVAHPAVASSSAPAYHPVASSSAPAYDSYPTATPAKSADNESSYAPTPAKTSAAHPESSSDASYDAGEGYGYSKRAGVVQRRHAAVAKRSNRVVVV